MTPETSPFRCTNQILKAPPEQIGKLTGKQLDKLPRFTCANPLLVIRDVTGNVLAHYCVRCDGPFHDHVRGPDVTRAYHARRATPEWRRIFGC